MSEQAHLLHLDSPSGADGGYCLACGMEVTQCRCPEVPVEYPGVPVSEVPISKDSVVAGGTEAVGRAGVRERLTPSTKSIRLSRDCRQVTAEAQKWILSHRKMVVDWYSKRPK